MKGYTRQTEAHDYDQAHEPIRRGLCRLSIEFFQRFMSGGQFEQFGELQSYEYLEPNLVLLYFPEAVIVVNLVEEAFIVLTAEVEGAPAQLPVDE